jgi:hypothetical protein
MLLVAASRTVALLLVFEKYEILQVLGQGSMGYVAAVQVRSGKVAGSATDPKKKRFNIFRKKGSNPKAIEETSEHTYALKTIQIDRVSTLFIEELENEVGCVTTTGGPSFLLVGRCTIVEVI